MFQLKKKKKIKQCKVYIWKCFRAGFLEGAADMYAADLWSVSSRVRAYNELGGGWCWSMFSPR